MRIAIVGTSHLTEDEEESALMQIETIVKRLSMVDTIITGDANGVDKLARSFSDTYQVAVFKAKSKKWGGDNGFKERNLSIAKEADYVYSITTKTKDEQCYHCNKDHQRTGGCFTLKMAKKFGKGGEVIII